MIAELRNRLRAVRAETFSAMQELIAKWSRGERFTPEEIGVRIREATNYGLNRAMELANRPCWTPAPDRDVAAAAPAAALLL